MIPHEEHDTNGTDRGQGFPDQSEKIHYHGFIHCGAMGMLADGIISAGEVVLLAVIDGLALSRGEGCWASSALLGERCGLSVRHIQRYLAHLTELGLVVPSPAQKMIAGQKRRTIETVWTKLRGVLRSIPHDVDVTPPMTPTSYKKDSSLRSDSSRQKSVVAGTSPLAAARPRGPVQATLTGVIVINGEPSQCRQWAVRLANIVEQVHKYRQKKSLIAWEKDFVLLLQEVGGDAARVENALRWYEDNAAIKGTFTVYSSKKFRQHFDVYDGKANRAERPTPSLNVESLKLAEKLTTELKWPPRAEKQLAACIQETADNWAPFIAKIRELRGERVRRGIKTVYPDGDDAALRLIDHLEDTGLLPPRPSAFAEKWMRSFHARYRTMPGWSGELGKAAFKPDHDRFQEIMLKAARDHGSAGTWKHIMGEVT